MPFIHQVILKDWRFILRIVYFAFAIIIDIISTFKNINIVVIHSLSWGLLIISLFPFPLYKTPKENNVLLKLLLYIYPLYILFTRSYEGLFLLFFYNYLQLWVKMKWREKSEEKTEESSEQNGENVEKYSFNLIDIFMYMTLSYTSAFSTGNIASISGFTLSSVFRFVSKYWPFLITGLIMIKILIPSIFVTVSLFEICKKYNYSSTDSLFMLIAMCEIMNIKFFFDIRDFGSWLEIGMSIAFFIISNVIAFLQFLYFLGVNLIFWADNKVNNEPYELIDLTPKKYTELELGIKNSNYSDIV